MNQEVIRILDADPDVCFAFLFGSRARGRVGPLSDHDFAVYLGSRDPGVRFQKGLRLAGTISSAVGTAAVDVVVLNDASPELGHAVLRDGQLLLCRDEDELVRYRVRTSSRYLDREPMRRLYRRYLMARLREGEFGVRR